MLCAAIVIPSLLALIGLLITWRREQPVIHAFVILSGILILCWPFAPKRFLLPLLPYLCTALLIGVGAVLRNARHLFADAKSNSRNTLEQWAAAGVALFLAIPAWSMNTRLLSARGVINANEQRGRLLTFIRENTPADACIAGAQGSTLHLLTGRQFVPIQSAPGAWAYSADRRPLAFGRQIAPGAERLAADTILKELVEYYTTAGVNYMLLDAKDDVEGGAYRRFLALNSDQFTLSAATPEFRLYYFVPSRPPPRAP